MSSRAEHTKILLGSLNKAFREAQRKGTYSVRDLFFLNCIQKTLNLQCEISMFQEEQRELVAFYFKILRSSNKFCVQEFSSTFYKDNGGIFGETYIQKNIGDVSPPEVDNFTLGDNGEVPVLEPIANISNITGIDDNYDIFMTYQFRQEVLDRVWGPDGLGMLIYIKRPTDAMPMIGKFTHYSSPVNLWNTANEYFYGQDVHDVYVTGTIIKFQDARGVYGESNSVVCL